MENLDKKQKGKKIVIYSILRKNCIPHFYSQFHDLEFKKFLICSEANK